MVEPPLRSCTLARREARNFKRGSVVGTASLTQIKFLAAWMRQGRLKAKQPWDVGLVYRSRTGERRLRHTAGRLTDFGFARNGIEEFARADAMLAG